MKISGIGNDKQKRACRVVLEAENEVEEAVLYQKFLELRAAPPGLAPWYQDVIDLLQKKTLDAARIGEELDIPNNASGNRMIFLMKHKLVARKAQVVAAGGRSYLYWPNFRGADEAPPSDILEGEGD